MAFDATNFGLKSGQLNSTLPRDWAYTTTDLAAEVDTAGYFDGVADFVSVGDRIFANIDTDGTPAYGYFVVSANDGTTVDVNDLVAVTGGTDTD